MDISIYALRQSGKRFFVCISSLFLTFLIKERLHAQATSDKDSLSLDSLIWNSPATTFNNSPWKKAGIVKNDERRGVPYETPEQLFAGRVAGVQVMETNGSPGGEFSVRVRGTGSLLNSAEPLYVIDGFPLDFFNNTFGIGQFDEQGESHATNALAMIDPGDIESVQIVKNSSALAIYGTRGANGVVLINTKKGNQKRLRVNFESSFSLQKMARKIQVLDAPEYLNFREKQAQYYPDESYIFKQFGDPANYQSVDWMDEATRSGAIQRQQLEVSGGTENLHLSILGGIYGHKGIVRESEFNRKNVRINLVGNFWKGRVEVGTNNYYGVGSTEFQSTEGLQRSAPIGPAYNADGSFHNLVIGKFELGNPLNTMRNSGTNNSMGRFMTNNYVQVSIVKRMSFRSQYSMSASKNDYDYRNSSNVSCKPAFGDVKDYYFDNAISYSKQDESGLINFRVGYTDQRFFNRSGIVIGEKERAINLLKEIRRDDYFSDGGSPLVDKFSWVSHKGSMKSYYLQSSYETAQKINVVLNFRGDRIPGGANDTGLSYYSTGIGGSWDLKKRMTGKHGIISSTKLLLDIGYQAKLNSVLTPYYDYLRGGKREVKNAFSIGAEIGLLAKKVKVEVDLYSQVNRNVKVPAYIHAPQTSPISLVASIDKMSSTGIDIGVSYKFFNSKELRFNISGNGSLFSNTIKNPGDLYGLVFDEDVKRSKRVGSWFFYNNYGVWNTKEEITSVYGTSDRTPPIGTTQTEFLNEGGKVVSAKRIYSGSANPNVIWGVASELAWKKLDLNLLFRGECGMRIDNQMGRYNFSGAFFDNVQVNSTARGWTPENVDIDFPRQGGGFVDFIPQQSAWFLQKGSFIRLQSMAIGYTVPLFKQKQDVRFYVSGQNLFLLTKYEGWDPEVNSNGQHAFLRGTDTGAYPRARTFTVGMQVHL